MQRESISGVDTEQKLLIDIVEGAYLYEYVTRALNVTVATVALVVALPFLIVLMVLVCLDSPGAPIFRQRRLGLGGKSFWFYKLRTMYADARERFPELYQYRYEEAEVATLRFKIPNDPRLTRVGSWLRRTSLDELPNFINVLKGDMNLVGPRPEIPEMLPYYRPDQHVKWSVRPGVTGLAQVYGRAYLAFQETVAYDLQYVRQRSLLLDLKILALTFWKVIRGVGAF
ncbi:MAG: sugar transferase [Chloroflexi bacterium]|nr:sugar transferase [Chloroflexota bacterium]